MATKKKATQIYLDHSEYEVIKARAKQADISVSKYFVRAGSLADVNEIIDYPKYSGGVPLEDKK